MIVGAHKAGTSALLRYLGAHPGIRAQSQQEMVYFTDPHLSRRDLTEYWDRYFGPVTRPSGLDPAHLGKLAGLMYEPEGLERLRRHNPDVEVVAILRDPVRRAYSAFWSARLKGREPLTSFEEAMRGDRARFKADHNSARICQYLDRGLYAKHLKRLYELFDRDRVHVFILEEFQRDANAVVAGLFRRLDLEPACLPAVAKRQNAARQPRSLLFSRLRWSRSPVTRAIKQTLPCGVRDAVRERLLRLNEVPWSPPAMASATERELRAYFAEPNRELERLLGRDLSMLWPGTMG
ncbi:MAG: sulfotransferase domain-containing protein [Egibacteraceae bacterium]